MAATFGQLSYRSRDRGRLEPVEAGLEALVVACAGAAADEREISYGVAAIRDPHLRRPRRLRRDYQRLKAGLDRLQSTTVATSIRQPAERRRHRFSWINEWKETADANGRALGIELILPDWFYAGVLEDALVLTIDRAYFSLTGGLERWLYRIVRKHGGRQDYGWSFDFGHLHAKSGSLSPLKHFVYDIRDIVRRQPLPGYSLTIERSSSGAERLSFKPSSIDPLAEAPRRCRVSQPAGDKL